MQLFRALMGRRSCLHPLPSHFGKSARIIEHDRQTISAWRREKVFNSVAVNYNFRRCSAKARLMLCMTQNQGWLISLSSSRGDGTFFSARGI